MQDDHQKVLFCWYMSATLINYAMFVLGFAIIGIGVFIAAQGFITTLSLLISCLGLASIILTFFSLRSLKILGETPPNPPPDDGSLESRSRWIHFNEQIRYLQQRSHAIASGWFSWSVVYIVALLICVLALQLTQLPVSKILELEWDYYEVLFPTMSLTQAQKFAIDTMSLLSLLGVILFIATLITLFAIYTIYTRDNNINTIQADQVFLATHSASQLCTAIMFAFALFGKIDQRTLYSSSASQIHLFFVVIFILVFSLVTLFFRRMCGKARDYQSIWSIGTLDIVSASNWSKWYTHCSQMHFVFIPVSLVLCCSVAASSIMQAYSLALKTGIPQAITLACELNHQLLALVSIGNAIYLALSFVWLLDEYLLDKHKFRLFASDEELQPLHLN